MRMVNFIHDTITNMMTDPLHMVFFFVSQLIRYTRVYSKYEDFLFRGSILVSKLLKLGYPSQKLQNIIRKFLSHHTDPVHNFV